MNNKLILSSIAIALFAMFLNILNANNTVKNYSINAKTALFQGEVTQMSWSGE